MPRQRLRCFSRLSAVRNPLLHECTERHSEEARAWWLRRDISVAAENAQFGFTEVKLGIVPALISPFVVARIGAANAREYFLTGEKFSAATAQSIGLVNHVVQNEAALDALIEAKLADILAASPAAIAATKDLILTVSGHPVESMSSLTAEASVRSRASTDAQAGVSAFLSHGKPPWVNS